MPRTPTRRVVYDSMENMWRLEAELRKLVEDLAAENRADPRLTSLLEGHDSRKTVVLERN